MLSPELARIRSFEVVPSLPEPLKPLLEIANNLWWSWHPEAVELFIRLDRELWRKSNHNPVWLLGNCSQHALDRAARDEGYLTSMRRIHDMLRSHLEATPWLARTPHDPGLFTVAYFCAEFGLTECLQIYSGGLGCLAGDHLKSASELGLPLVGVGLLYRNGYFQQYLNADGWQQEYTPDLDFSNLPVKPVCQGDSNEQVKIHVQLPGRDVAVALWKVKVGRIDLYLLDTNLPENEAGDRAITSQLYGGDMEMRIKQEIVLGIGGVRALAAIGIEPDICHLNEGHSAFLALERIRMLVDKHDITFDEARQAAGASHVFTTHTPVPAGIDRFSPEMIQRYFKDYHPQLRLDIEGLLALGRENVFNKNEFFSMAVLALRTSERCNGVSKLHGSVSRNMWQNIWPGLPEDEVPITHVTNGVHTRSWMSADLIYMLDRYIGSRWQDDPADATVWESVQELPDEELWRVHERRRQKLCIWARRRLRHQLEARGANPDQVRSSVDAINPNALTVGFARRFATYKRGNLILRNPERLVRMISNAERPIQFIIAGKAHPADSEGKELIRQLVHFARESEAGHSIVFLENYDIHVARYMVQGCDIWLNTPRRGLEASGTSGMKAALNGVLNVSILDGWWDEGFQSEVGWSIGRGETYANPDVQDEIESQALYDLLEQQVIPMFYDRDDHGLPRLWIERMKSCISTLAPFFNTNRMVQEYTEHLYLPALRRKRLLGEGDLARSVEFAHVKDHLRHAWNQISIEDVAADTGQTLGVRDKLELAATVHLGPVAADQVRVQAYHGKLDNTGRIARGRTADLTYDKDLGDGRHRFVGKVSAQGSGKHGFAVRVVPGGEIFENIPEPGLIRWENAGQKKGDPKRQKAAAV